jgi:hypothetical protein
MPAADHIIEMGQKTRPQPESRVTHCRQAFPELSKSFDGIDRRETGQIFDLQIADMHQKVPKSLFELALRPIQ